MPTRTEIVQLDSTEKDKLAEARKKEPIEQMLKTIRTTLNEGTDHVRVLQNAATVDAEAASTARDALQHRRHLITLVPSELITDEVRSAALDPIDTAIELCDEILRETPAPSASAPAGDEGRLQAV